MIYPEKELFEKDKEIKKLKREIDLIKRINNNNEILFDKSVLGISTIHFLEKHLKEIENYLKELKKIIKYKKINTPKMRLHLKNNKYAYVNYYDARTKESKSEYLGKFEDEATKIKIEQLVRKHPEIENQIK